MRGEPAGSPVRLCQSRRKQGDDTLADAGEDDEEDGEGGKRMIGTEVTVL